MFLLDTGAWGAGLATALGAAISFAVMLGHFFSKKNTLRLVRPARLAGKLRQIVTAGFSTFFIDIAMGLLTMLFNRQIMRWLGADALAVYGVIVNISTFVQCCAYSVGQAAQPIISVNFGARQWGRIRQTLRCALCAAAFFSIVWTALVFAFPHGFVRIFMAPTPQILRIAPFILRSYGLSFLLLPLNIFSTYYFQALMKPGAAFFISVARGLVLSGALILLLHARHRGRGGHGSRRADGALYARTGHQCGKGVRKAGLTGQHAPAPQGPGTGLRPCTHTIYFTRSPFTGRECSNRGFPPVISCCQRPALPGAEGEGPVLRGTFTGKARAFATGPACHGRAGPAPGAGRVPGARILQKRRKQPQHCAEQSAPEAGAAVFQMHLARGGKCLQHVLLQICQCRAAVQQRAALEMQVQASEIHIDSAHYAHSVVGKVAFGVHEAGRIFVYPHACAQQRGIV